MKYHLLLQCFIVSSLFLITFAAGKNPYETLKIDKKSNLQDIRKAYKRLAKEW
jgi:DnaJ-class molecular chaperone